jgi:hypothetical protein
MSGVAREKSQRVHADGATGKGKVKLARAALDAEIGKHAREQKLIWDPEQPRLCVLVSRGPKGGKAKDPVTTLLLHKIEKKQIKCQGRHLGGALTASATLARISKLFNWHAARSGDFTV